MTDCAILAIASTTQTVRALLQRLVNVDLDEQVAAAVPWTIVNKYYTAEVKFLVRPLSSWDSIQDELLAPALLFVWNRGEPYRNQIHKFFQCASRHEFEVALAIRLPPTSSVAPADAEDDQDIDAYLSSRGFEFVDVADAEPPSFDHTGIPGIPRIVDALSTIMWPSMVRQTSKRVTTTGVINGVQSDSSISSGDYHNLVRLVGEKISGNDGDRMQRELEELERWLDEDTLSGDADARSADGENEAALWSTVVTPGTLSPSLSGFFENSRPTTPKVGFDDDFTSFISASSANSSGVPRDSSEGFSSPPRFSPHASASFSPTFSFNSTSSGHSTPILDDRGSFDTTHLVPGSYKSLGSASDLGDLDKESARLEQLSNRSDNEGMPSWLEIAETSRKIFGTVPFPLIPIHERGDEPPQVRTAPGRMSSQSYSGEDPDMEMTDDNLEHFDLRSVLSALQGLKEEIAEMPDQERRKAAARVALSFAYGVGGDPRSAVNERPV